MSEDLNYSQQKPVIFLAFAGNLPSLTDEYNKIWEALKETEKNGWCEVIERAYTSIATIFDVFQDSRYRNRIAVFHFAGHADSWGLVLQDGAAHKEGLVPFLARRKGLNVIFLNGCCTAQQARELTDAGVPAVIGTYNEIADNAAADLAIRFYKGIADGLSLEEAWLDTVDDIKSNKEKYPPHYRRVHWQGKKEREDDFPWGIEYSSHGSDITKCWSLPQAVKDPLFGLPSIPRSYGYPQPPFRFLQFYKREHARIFFGRSWNIRELYFHITGQDTPPIILLYGQSGVGKSSLLEAGLFPRLEESHVVIYTRLNSDKSLSHTLEDSILSLAGGASLVEIWKQVESQTGKPLVVILDQVEEVFTDTNRDFPNELENFVETLKTIFKNPVDYPQGKLILGYRKEFHAEIDNKFRNKFYYYSMLLYPLNRESIIEVVTGLTRNEKLRGQYKLVVEDRLPVVIADDLMEDKATPVAPVLQFILSKMWETAENGNADSRQFTIDGYQTLRKEGIAMKNFFDIQMKELEKCNNEVVKSGLALDLLKFHTTPMITARSRGMDELRQTYGNRHDILEELIKMAKNFYLLTDIQYLEKQNKMQGTSLAHDTLAPIVLDEYNKSDKLGQRAGRILATKVEDFKRSQDKVWLDETDLEIVEQGRKGMRELDKEENELLEISRERKEQRERAKKRNNRIKVSLFILIIIVVIVTIFAIFQMKVAEKRKNETTARRLAVIAESVLKNDPTLALRIAEKAWLLDKNQTVNGTIYKIYRENSFYKIIGTHKETISSVAFSPDGKTILTGSFDDTARLWDLQGNPGQVFKGHGADITSVSFSPDGKMVLTGSNDKTARLWNLEGKPLKVINGHNDFVTSVAFSPDGNTILTGTGDKSKKAYLWDINGKKLQEFEHTGRLSAVAFSPDGRYILTGSWDKTARLWDRQGNSLEVFEERQNQDKDIVTSVAFSPDGNTILIGSNKITRLWDMEGNPGQVFTGHTDVVTSVAFSPDGKTILTGSGAQSKKAHLWDLNGNMLQEFNGHIGYVSSVAFSPDGKTILTGSGDFTARLWDLRNNTFQEFKEHIKAVNSVTFSPDGKTILLGSDDNTARLWDLRNNTFQEFKEHIKAVNSVAFSPDGKTILTGSDDNTARLWGLNGKSLKVFKNHGGPVTCVAFSPNGQNILTGSDDNGNTARLWDLEGNSLMVFTVHEYTVTSVAFSPNGQNILTGSDDNFARLWDLEGNPLKVIKGHTNSVTSVAFSPREGKTILTGSKDNTARLWDLEANLLMVLNGYEDTVTSVAFSPDGQNIVTGSVDNTACIWDLNGNLIQVFKGHTNTVSSVAFSPDGNYILSGSEDNTARLWRLAMPLDEFLEHGHLEPLTTEQKNNYGIKD